jgi:hypothetical protein
MRFNTVLFKRVDDLRIEADQHLVRLVMSPSIDILPLFLLQARVSIVVVLEDLSVYNAGPLTSLSSLVPLARAGPSS